MYHNKFQSPLASRALGLTIAGVLTLAPMGATFSSVAFAKSETTQPQKTNHILTEVKKGVQEAEQQAKPAAQQTNKQTTLSPRIVIASQPLTQGEITVRKVVSQGTGWLAIQSSKDGKPDAVLGEVEVKDGINNDLKVKVDAKKATGKLFAILYADKGAKDKFEVPGADKPEELHGKSVMRQFEITKK